MWCGYRHEAFTIYHTISMIVNNMYGQFFEDSLVQMIMFNDFQLFSEDIAGKDWSEVDTVDDLLKAQLIHHANQ